MWMASVCGDGITKIMIGENQQRDPGVYHRWREKDFRRKANL